MKKEKVLKILTFIALIALFVSIYIKYGQSFANELLNQKKDEQRITDLDKLNDIIKKKMAENEHVIFGEPNKVYISIPSSRYNCEDLSLPTLSKGWEYRCADKNNLTLTNGKGWLPININSDIKQLPIDPENNASNLTFYSFVAGSVNAFNQEIKASEKSPNTQIEYQTNEIGSILTATMETKKYLKKKAEQDNGTDSTRYEVGPNIKLWADANGLISYWPFDEGYGNLVNDKSGNNRNGLIDGGAIFWETKNCPVFKCIGLDGKDDEMSFTSALDLSNKDEGSYIFWFKLTNIPSENSPIFNPGVNRLDVNIEGETGKIFVWMHNKDQVSGDLVYKTKGPEYSDNKWHNIAVVKNKKSIIVYIDGKQKNMIKTDLPIKNTIPQGTITIKNNDTDQEVSMYIDEVRIFNRALNANEIKKLVIF